MLYEFDSPQDAAKAREEMDKLLGEVADKLKAVFNDCLRREAAFITKTEVVNPS